VTQTRRDFWSGVAVLALLCLAGTNAARAQDAVVKGRVVSDRGEPIVGANVFIEELRLAANTANDGRYVLTVPGGRVRGQTLFLRARGIGFKPGSKQFTLTAGEQSVDFTLVYDVNLLQAVVVTGVQEATEAANINSFQMRSSFGNHEIQPGRILLNSDTPPWVRGELRRMGYTEVFDDRTSGPINAIMIDRPHGTFWGGSSNHGEDYGIGW